jgi:serine/threonine protein kinase
MGEVFRGTDEQLGRPVAVKLLLPTEDSSRAAERFHREARTAARLSDPHVVSVYDFGQHGDGFFLVMELVEGHTVAAELAEHGSLPKDRAIDIVEQAATGLAAAHLEGVVHRDIKPANLLVTADGTVKVADFGIAHLPGEGAATLTVTGEIIGSMHYLAPERARGGQAGQAADVYSLGCVLYHLVTGEPPFTAEHPAAILYQHVDAAPTVPSLTRPELGGAFEHALLRMLAKDAADRPSAAEIASGALRGNDYGPAAGVPAASAVDAEPATSPLQAPAPNPSRKMVLLAGAAAVLATTAAVAAVVLLGNETEQPPTTEIGPQPGVSSSTPSATTTSSSTTDPTQAGTTTQTAPTTSAPTSETPSQQPSPTPTPTDTPSTTPSSTPSESTTPSVSPSSTPSSTPPSDTPAPSTPATGSPTPDDQTTPIQPGSD